MSGTPFSVSGNCGANWNGSSPTMVNLVSTPQKLGETGGKGSYWYDPTAFADVLDGAGNCLPQLGRVGFNTLRAPGVFNWDFGLFRDFAISERVKMQFRAESFNFTNTPHFASPDSCLCDAATIAKNGQVTTGGSFMAITGVQDLAREGIDERQFRVGLRFSF
jgi:hypothetical protein